MTDDATLLAGMRDGVWLDAQEFPPLEYAVPGVIPEGFGLLVAPPKAGKSWLVAGVGLGCAAGGLVFGRIRVERPRPVCYWALEDGHRRLQSRFRHLMLGEPIPAGINVITQATTALIVPMMAEFLLSHADEAPLLILDTLGRVKPPKAPGAEAYQAATLSEPNSRHASTASAARHCWWFITRASRSPRTSWTTSVVRLALPDQRTSCFGSVGSAIATRRYCPLPAVTSRRRSTRCVRITDCGSWTATTLLRQHTRPSSAESPRIAVTEP
jgi:hypothetical protein